MSLAYQNLQVRLAQQPQRWLVTGAGGFIGSHLVEKLLSLGQVVVGVDNFATGRRENLVVVQSALDAKDWNRFTLIQGDICDLKTCQTACEGIDFVLHQAALGSVPRSVKDPLASHASNVNGFLNLLVASRDAGVSRFVYASSSSVYGDSPTLPKVEHVVGRPLSPYAATKAVDEMYAEVFFRSYQLPVIGLRYFNVFGPRQDPEGPYAAVIPRWFNALMRDESVQIFGDGETSRDFCYVANVIQANLLAAVSLTPGAIGQVYNIALGERTTLRQLLAKMEEITGRRARVSFLVERSGDVRHSLADITRARCLLGYAPTHFIDEGLKMTMAWFGRAAKSGAGLGNRPVGTPWSAGKVEANVAVQVLSTELPIVLGTAQLGMRYGIANRTGQPSEASASEMLEAAVRCGIRILDTARNYGSSELLIGKFLHGRPGAARVLTKLSPEVDAWNADSIRRSVEESLARLQLRTLWCLMLHREEHLEDWSGTLGQTLVALRASGLVQNLGASIYSPEFATQVLSSPDLGALEIPANVFDRRCLRAGIFAGAVERGKQVFIRSIFLQGLALMDVAEVPDGIPRGREAVAALREFCARHGCGLREFAFDYVRCRYPQARFVLGAETPVQIEANAGLVGRTPLDPAVADEWDRAWPEDISGLVNPSIWPH